MDESSRKQHNMSSSSGKPPVPEPKRTVDQHIVDAATTAGKELATHQRDAAEHVRGVRRQVSGELRHLLNEQNQTLRDPERLRALCAQLRATDRCPGECVIRSALRATDDTDLRHPRLSD